MSPTASSTLLSPDHPACGAVRRILDASGFEEVAPCFLVPAPGHGTTADATAPYYPIETTTRRGGRVCLRSHGRDFNIIPGRWRRTGLVRVYSIGPAVDHDLVETTVVLAQCLRPEADLMRRLTAGFATAGLEADICSGHHGEIPCLRLSAVLPPHHPDDAAAAARIWSRPAGAGLSHRAI